MGAINGRFGVGEVNLSSEARPEPGSNGTFSSCGNPVSGREQNVVTTSAVGCAGLREGLEVKVHWVRTLIARLPQLLATGATCTPFWWPPPYLATALVHHTDLLKIEQMSYSGCVNGRIGMPYVAHPFYQSRWCDGDARCNVEYLIRH